MCAHSVWNWFWLKSGSVVTRTFLFSGSHGPGECSPEGQGSEYRKVKVLTSWERRLSSPAPHLCSKSWRKWELCSAPLRPRSTLGNVASDFTVKDALGKIYHCFLQKKFVKAIGALTQDEKGWFIPTFAISLTPFCRRANLQTWCGVPWVSTTVGTCLARRSDREVTEKVREGSEQPREN